MPPPRKPPATPPETVVEPPPLETPPSDETRALLPFLDVPVVVTVELARKRLKVREILDLQVDSIVQMNQSAGENVDLRLNGIAVGNGEIVVLEDMMGLRVTDLKLRAADHE